MRPVKRDNRPGGALHVGIFMAFERVMANDDDDESFKLGLQVSSREGSPDAPQMCSNETRNVVLFIARHVPARGYVTRNVFLSRRTASS